ncbi:molybdopterin-dependent oxidoreductase [Cellulomonas sp. NS3]|uniref:molybdopterin-dependent oxidoreductase n=1 Tax=Cellulomonas sp. NS3 TaxID=2973977 RepID=UPI00216259A3|nr:molybdopterin-dependent oxidoreductase [Cellulomonas sp. NS3]
MPRTRFAALAGLAAGAVTLGVAALAAGLVSASADPLVAVGATFVDATPAWLKDLAIAAFGTADKLALTVGSVVVLAGLAALAGVLAARRWAFGAALVVLLGAVGALAAASRPDAGLLAPVPSLVGALAGLLVLRWLVGRLPGRAAAAGAAQGSARTDPARDAFLVSRAGTGTAADTAAGTGGPPPTGDTNRTAVADPVRSAGSADRRSFLRLTGALAVGGALAVVAGRTLGAGRRAVEAVRETLRLPVPTRAAALPAGVDSGVPGVDPWVTRNSTFYRIDTALTVPRVDPATWSLRVHGLVEREVTLTFDELLDSDLVEAWVTLACVSNEVGGDLVGNARWLGLPVRELLERAGPLPDADMVLSTSADGFTASTPIEALTDDRDALLAVGMNGEPLPVEHGFPVRMVVPGLYGYVSATKWVVDLEVTRFADAEAYWTVRGWSERGPVKTQSRIEVPRHASQVTAGRVVVAGTAWAQHRGVEEVEVRVDEGPWERAKLAADGGIDTWRQWTYAWEATPGEHELQVRASDPDGPQTAVVARVVPDGATGHHTVRVRVADA